MKTYSSDKPVNIGTGTDISVAEFARLVAEVVGYLGHIAFDPLRPDGAPQKVLDVSRLTKLGWTTKTSLRDGLAHAYADFLARGAANRGVAAP